MLTIHGGRTGVLWQDLEKQAAASRAQNKRCLLLVPEQYTLQAEKNLIKGLNLPGFFDIEVFSYSRFIQRLFLLYNPMQQKRVDGNGKNIAIHAEYPVGNYSEPAALLRDAQHNEMQEYSHDYRLFSQIAQQEGFDEIAKLFKLIAEIEHTHSQRFMQYADLLDSGRLFSETEHTAWLCLNCGHIHTGTQAPGICPVCTHPQGYFIRAQQTIGA